MVGCAGPTRLTYCYYYYYYDYYDYDYYDYDYYDYDYLIEQHTDESTVHILL